MQISFILDTVLSHCATILVIFQYAYHRLFYRPIDHTKYPIQLNYSNDCDRKGKVRIFIPGGCALMPYQLGFVSTLIEYSKHRSMFKDKVIFEGVSSGALCSLICHASIHDNIPITDAFVNTVLPMYKTVVESSAPTFAGESIKDYVKKTIALPSKSENLTVYTTRVPQNFSDNLETLEMSGIKTLEHLHDAMLSAIHIPLVTTTNPSYFVDRRVDGFVGSIIDHIASDSKTPRILILNNTSNLDLSVKTELPCIEGSAMYCIGIPDTANPYTVSSGYMFNRRLSPEYMFYSGAADALSKKEAFDEALGKLLTSI